MPEWKVTQFIFLDLYGNGRYAFRYPSAVFPRECPICGQPTETSVSYSAHKSKTISTTYTTTTRRDSVTVASMSFSIPLCSKHAGEISEYEKTIVRRDKISKILVVVSALLGFLTALWVFVVHYHNQVDFGTILLSLFLGALGGGFLLGALSSIPLYFIGGKKPRPPCEVAIHDDNNKVSMRLVFTFFNDHFFEEYKRLSNVEGHLLSVMDHPDESISVAAMGALAQAGCTTAATNVLRKLIDHIGKVGFGGIYDYGFNAAANCLEKLGVPQPPNPHSMDQLAAGLQYGNSREPVAMVLALYGMEYVLPHLKDPDPRVCITILHAIKSRRMAEAVPAIIPLLLDPRKSGLERVSAAAARALRAIGTPEALAAVKRWKKFS